MTTPLTQTHARHLLLISMILASAFFFACEEKGARANNSTTPAPEMSEGNSPPARLRLTATLEGVTLDALLVEKRYPNAFSKDKPVKKKRLIMNLEQGKLEVKKEKEALPKGVVPIVEALEHEREQLAALIAEHPELGDEIVLSIAPTVPLETAQQILWTVHSRTRTKTIFIEPDKDREGGTAPWLKMTRGDFVMLAPGDRSRTTEDNIIKCIDPSIHITPRGASVRAHFTIGPSDGIRSHREQTPEEIEERRLIKEHFLKNPQDHKILGQLAADRGSPRGQGLGEGALEAVGVGGGEHAGWLGFGLAARGGTGVELTSTQVFRRAARAISSAVWQAEYANNPRNGAWVGDDCPSVSSKLPASEQRARLGALLGTLKKVHPICFEGASIIFEEGTWGDAAFALETLREQGIHLDNVYEAHEGYRSCAAPMKPDAFIEASKVSLEKHRAWLRAEAKERAEAREREDKSSK